jgi:hypothetical protein
LGDWAVAGSGKRGWLMVADLLIFIRVLFFLTADFGCATKKIGGYHQNAKVDTVHCKDGVDVILVC